MESVRLGKRYRICRIAKSGKRMYMDWTITATSNAPKKSKSSCRIAFPHSITAYTANLGSLLSYASSTWMVEEHVVPCSSGLGDSTSKTSCVVTVTSVIAPRIWTHIFGFGMTRGAIMRRVLYGKKTDMEVLEKRAVLLMSTATVTATAMSTATEMADAMENCNEATEPYSVFCGKRQVPSFARHQTFEGTGGCCATCATCPRVAKLLACDPPPSLQVVVDKADGKQEIYDG